MNESAFVAELEQRWPDSPRVRRWARVLAPAEVRLAPGVPSRSFDSEYEWLRQHRREYPGCWLAVQGDHLVAANPDLARVYEALQGKDLVPPPLIHLEGPARQ